MIRLVARLTLLHRLRLEMDQGRPFEAACQALFVKLPMSARRALAKQAERWTTESIAQRLPAVRLASARVRTETQLAEVLATRALWALASGRRGGGGNSVTAGWNESCLAASSSDEKCLSCMRDECENVKPETRV